MPKIVEKSTGKTFTVPDESVQRMLDHPSGDYELASGETRTLREDGMSVTVSSKDAEAFLEAGLRPETVEEAHEIEEKTRIDREHGGIGSKVATVVEGAASSASLGMYDAIGGAIGGDGFRRRRREQSQASPGLDLGGEVLGYLAPTGIAKLGGTAAKLSRGAPISVAERLGSKIAATGANKGFLRQAGAKGLGLGVEGAIVGAGETLSEYSLAMTDLERERATSNLSSNMIFGAATGGAIGAGSEVAIRGIRKAKKLADGLGERMAKRASVSDDVARLDRAGIKEARAAEQARISEELYESGVAYRDLLEEVDPILIARGQEERILIKSRDKIRNELYISKKFKERPGRIKDALLEQEHALEKVLAGRDDMIARLAKEDASLIRKIDKSTDEIVKGKLAKRWGEFSNTNVTKGMAKEGIELTAEQHGAFRAALKSGELGSKRAKALGRIEEVLGATRKQIENTDHLLKGTSPRLAELTTAEDLLKTNGGAKPKGFVEKATTNAVYGGVMGAASTVLPLPAAALAASAVSNKIADAVFGGLGKAATKTAKSSAAVVDGLMDAGVKTLQRTPPLATKILAGTKFAKDTPEIAASIPKATLVGDFKAREAEIYSQVHRGPNGITMKPAARRKLADSLSGVRVASPELADSIETIVNRRVSFLADKLPKKPDYLAYVAGPDVWQPSNEAIRTFARYVAAAEDPDSVELRLADGTLSYSDVETYKAIYPERYGALVNEIATRLPELQANLSMTKRVALSIFTGLPIEPAMNPHIYTMIQAQFPGEPGTEGGTHAPKPQANFGVFGSSKSQEKTRSQKRAE